MKYASSAQIIEILNIRISLLVFATCVNIKCSHLICLNCILYASTELTCSEFINIKKNACRKCFRLISLEYLKIVNPSCDFKHFYCEEFFIDKDNQYCEDFCMYCKEIYYDPNGLCVLCKKDKEEGIASCSEHIICNECLKLITSQSKSVYINIINCEGCEVTIATKISMKDTLIEKVLAEPARDCSINKSNNNLISIEERNFDCPLLYSTINQNNQFIPKFDYPSNPTIVRDACESCTEIREYIVSHCKNTYCTHCVKLNPTKLSLCNICKELINKICMNCFRNINDNDLKIINPACKKKHVYCVECYKNGSDIDNENICKFCKESYNFNIELYNNCILCHQP